MDKGEELFRFADNMRCKEYYLDTVKGVKYIRPLTSILYKKINSEKSQAIYEHMMDFLKRYKRPYNTIDFACILKELENSILVFDEKELTILNHKAEALCRYFTHLHQDRLKTAHEQNVAIDSMKHNFDSEPNEYDEYEKSIKHNENTNIIRVNISQHYLSKTMDVFLEYLLIMDLPLEISMSSFYYNEYFLSYEFKEADVILSDIGFLLKDKDLADIMDFENWKESDKKSIETAILKFANAYGLLGILSKIFSFDDSTGQMYYSYQGELDKVSVRTILADAYASANLSKSEHLAVHKKQNNNKHILSESLNAKEYIKIFFPEDRQVFFEAYQLHDERYWNVYSEPIYIFLLGAKIYYDEYFRYQKNHNNPQYGDSRNTVRQMPIVSKVNFTYNTVTEGYIMDYAFRSLLEGLIFYSKKKLIHSSNTVIYCVICGKPVSGKNPKKKPKYCGKNCRESVSSNNYYENNAETIKEKRRNKTAERKNNGKRKA